MRVILIGWSLAIVITNEVTTIKSEETWTKANSLANINFKTLNVIFASINVNQFKLISAYESARDV